MQESEEEQGGLWMRMKQSGTTAWHQNRRTQHLPGGIHVVFGHVVRSLAKRIPREKLLKFNTMPAPAYLGLPLWGFACSPAGSWCSGPAQDCCGSVYHLLAMWVSGPCRSVQLLGQDVHPAAVHGLGRTGVEEKRCFS